MIRLHDRCEILFVRRDFYLIRFFLAISLFLGHEYIRFVIHRCVPTTCSVPIFITQHKNFMKYDLILSHSCLQYLKYTYYWWVYELWHINILFIIYCGSILVQTLSTFSHISVSCKRNVNKKNMILILPWFILINSKAQYSLGLSFEVRDLLLKMLYLGFQAIIFDLEVCKFKT